MGIGCVEMVIGRIRPPADAETVAIFVGHPGADRRVIFYYMSVAVDYFVDFGTHVFSPFSFGLSF
jgi:hypothetical protein